MLHYLIRSGAKAGSYTLPVALSGSELRAGTSKKVTDQASGVELAWLPAAKRWAVVYRESGDAWKRCWVTP